jgi:hypothetical protein
MIATLPALLVAAAFGIACVQARHATWSVVVFAAIAVFASFVPTPAVWTERAHLACWIAIVACSASVHLPPFGSSIAFVLAVAAGASAGVITRDSSTLALLPVVAVAALIAARVLARPLPVATKVVSSWLIAVALLAATLQMLPVTPGYLPDHLE